ncbi:site-specific integrase [Diaphorobacter nitroreducens]|uniref:site-specific integrase n=1 Tax=Diaphorobacter nitroreducens TaxID=164759 RepID=UPI002897BAD8|nr:site-specific integrase [Diaphorobacter nitroreducens]
MAHIENRSGTQVTVKNRDDLTRCFPHDKSDNAKRYCANLRAQGFKPVVAALDGPYLVRYRVNGKRRTYRALDQDDAIETKKRVEAEQHTGLFIDYSQAHQTTFAELLIKYLRDEAPRHKGFLVTAYQINRWLEDAGLERQDIAAIHAAHGAPQNRKLHIPHVTGRRMSARSDAAAFIRKKFAKIGPEDFREYIDERLQLAAPATVDREIDVFRAVCTTALETWRIHVHIHPMSGLERPKYFNERDRRLHPGEEERLMQAAEVEDQQWTRRALADRLTPASSPTTKYQRALAARAADEAFSREGWHVPLLATFIQFQLMTGARKSETLKLAWNDLDLERQTAFLPDTKNGRARNLPLRNDLVALLQDLPRTSEYVFPISGDYLRKAWQRISKAAGIANEGPERLRIHDLRHEAISRVAEAGSQTPGGFSLLDLQAFSGHRDPRMLLRYTHLTPTGLARRLDTAFAAEDRASPGAVTTHRGRTRLTKGARLPMAELMSTSLNDLPRAQTDAEQAAKTSVTSAPAASNVVSLDVHRKLRA